MSNNYQHTMATAIVIIILRIVHVKMKTVGNLRVKNNGNGYAYAF